MRLPSPLLLFFVYTFGDLRDLHSFPTRRSSDLGREPSRLSARLQVAQELERFQQPPGEADAPRSEEHTSELQSHVNLVCRLLLEKKKKKQIKHNTNHRHSHQSIRQAHSIHFRRH